MELLDRFWTDASFRKAVGDLLSLTPAEMETLRRLTDKSFDLPGDTATQFHLDPTDFGFALTLLGALYAGAREEGESAVIGQLGRLAASRTDGESRALAANLEAKHQEFTALLEPRPEYELSRRRGVVQRSAMAALEDINLFVDLRLVDEPGDDPKMVPVVLARLGFDEPIQPAAGSVTFQIPDRVMAALREQLERAEKSVADAKKRFGDQLL